MTRGNRVVQGALERAARSRSSVPATPPPPPPIQASDEFVQDEQPESELSLSE